MKSPVATGVHRVQDVIGELHRYVTGGLHYFGISHTYSAVLELEE